MGLLEHYAYLTQYVDGLRLDLTFETMAYMRGVTLDSATVVLINKEREFSEVERSDRDYWIRLPDNGAYRGCCDEFWWTTPYVAKAVARGQLIGALELMGKAVRPQFARMLTWLAGANGGPAANVGKHGTNLGDHVPSQFYDALLASYPRADLVEIRCALHELVRAFPSVAQAVADALGYVYEAREGERASAFLASHFPGSCTSG